MVSLYPLTTQTESACITWNVDTAWENFDSSDPLVWGRAVLAAKISAYDLVQWCGLHQKHAQIANAKAALTSFGCWMVESLILSIA